jgi:hypothetical protein
MLYSLYFVALQCDESCDERSGLWQDDPDAWQWTAQFAIAGLGAVAALYALWAALTGRRALPALLVAATSWSAWWIWVSP